MITQTTTIRGMAYRLVKLNPIQGGRLALRVGTLIAAAAEDTSLIGELINAHKGQEGSDKLASLVDAPKLMQALAGGLAKLDADVLFDIGMQCIRGNLFTPTRKLHDDTAIDDHFGEHPDHMLMVMAWAIKENCAGFFGLGAKV